MLLGDKMKNLTVFLKYNLENKQKLKEKHDLTNSFFKFNSKTNK